MRKHLDWEPDDDFEDPIPEIDFSYYRTYNTDELNELADDSGPKKVGGCSGCSTGPKKVGGCSGCSTDGKEWIDSRFKKIYGFVCDIHRAVNTFKALIYAPSQPPPPQGQVCGVGC